VLNGDEPSTSFPSRCILGKAARFAFVPSIYELEKESKVEWADLQVADVRAEFGGNVRRSKM
jgi:hypothetical protein